MRRTTASLALVLAPLLLAGCGDKDTDNAVAEDTTSATTSATPTPTPEAKPDKAEFCAAQKVIVDQTLAATSGKVDADKLEAAYEKTDEIGLPDGAPADVEEGYKISMDQADKIDWDALAKDPTGYLAEMGKGVDAEDSKKALAYGQWIVTTCKLAG
jgi:hypothetical protein